MSVWGIDPRVWEQWVLNNKEWLGPHMPIYWDKSGIKDEQKGRGNMDGEIPFIKDLNNMVVSLSRENVFLKKEVEELKAIVKELKGQQENQEELLPCPFCGCEVEVCKGVSEAWYIACDNPECDINAATYNHETQNSAVKSWNTRFSNE